MPVESQPQDKPAAVCFHFDFGSSGLDVTCNLVTSPEQTPYTLEGGAPHFTGRDDFKARALSIGMSPSVAEDQRRSFNATARQLRELGFSVHVKEESKA